MFAKIATMLGLAAVPVQASEKIVWPDLPTTGFIAGRVATVDDAKRGDAIFSMNGQGRGALPITIPQYVKWTDQNGIDHPMILVQAEQVPDGSKIVGLRDFLGQETAATLPELTLLGTKKPN